MTPAALALALFAWGPAAAEPPVVDLAWELRTPDRCDAVAFEEKLAELMAGEGAADQSPLKVKVRLSVDESGDWLAELWLGEVEGAQPRRFESTRCEAVVEAAALVVAMELDPSALDRLVDEPAPASESTSEIEESAPPEEQPEAEPGPTEASPSTEAPPSRDVALGVRTGVASLGLPGTTAAFGARVWLRDEHWRVGVGGRYRMPTRVEGETAGGGEFSYVAGRVDACGVLRPGPVLVPLCGGFEAGQLLARGVEVSDPATSRRPWLAARVGPGLEFAVTDWLSLGASLELGVVISRERYFQTGVGRIYEVGPIELGGAIELQFRIFGGRR